MEKEDLTIAIHGAHSEGGGIYNMLGNFTQGLLKGFQQTGVRALSTRECVENRMPFQAAIGFNVSDYAVWEEILNCNIFNIMWTVDSCFAANFPIIQKFEKYPTFAVFGTYPHDVKPIKAFLPDLKYAYLAHATDTDFWVKKDVEKEYDITFMSSVNDYEARLEQLKASTTPDVFKIFTDFYELTLANPKLPLFELYEIFCKHLSMPVDLELYLTLYKEILTITESQQKIQMIKSLKDFPVKVFGNETWKKYISGNQQYCGIADVTGAVDIMNKSKIILHSHPEQLGIGLHERILNASATENFVLTSDAQTIRAAFENSLGYFTFEDVAQKAEYYLKHEDERVQMAKSAREITLRDHTWKCRAEQILEILL